MELRRRQELQAVGWRALDIEASKRRCESFEALVRRHDTCESVPIRLINPASSAIVVIMQRLHADDVAGTAIALNLGYEHLMLPMEFEPDRRCHTSIGFKDPRR